MNSRCRHAAARHAVGTRAQGADDHRRGLVTSGVEAPWRGSKVSRNGMRADRFSACAFTRKGPFGPFPVPRLPARFQLLRKRQRGLSEHIAPSGGSTRVGITEPKLVVDRFAVHISLYPQLRRD